MIYALIILLGFIAGYRETEILIKTGKWVKEGSWIPIWETTFKIFGITIKTDSFHFMVGAFAVVMFFAIVFYATIIMVLLACILIEVMK